jgi:putative transposase
MKAAYSAKEISGALGISPRAVHLRAQKEGWPSGEEQCRGGRAKKYGPAGFLPNDVQEKIADYMLQATLRSAMKASPVPMNEKMPQNGNLPILASCACDLTNKDIRIPEKSDKKGLAKYQLVKAWKEIIDTQPWSKRGEASEAFLLAYRTGRMLPGVYGVLGEVALKSLYKYEKQLREARGDYQAIADGRGGWRKHGTNLWKPRALSDGAKEALLSCWLRPEKPTVALAIRAARISLERRGIEEVSEDSSWRRWLRDYERRHRDVVVLAREGEKAYRDKVGPYITRDADRLSVGQVLIADGHDLNFEILHPQTGKPARLKLVMFFDWASRMPVGWQIMPTENTTVISAALRNAIHNLGKVPEIVYLDNGKAFKSKIFCETSPDLAELTGLYARLGIATCFAAPYNARAKIIERFFLTMQEQFERLVPSYCGSSIPDKPAWRSRNEKFHRAMHEKRTGGYVPDIREAAYVLSLYIDWYGRQPHEGLGGRLPIDVLNAGRGPGVDAAALDYEFLWSKKVTPRRCRVTLYGIDYESDCLHGWGEEVIAKYDTANLGKIFLYAAGGSYLGEARPVSALSPIARLLGDQVGVDQVKGEIKRQRRLAKETKRNLIELGADPERVESLDALPWNQRMAVLPGGKEEQIHHEEHEEHEEGKEIDQAERTRLELVVSRAATEIEARAAKPPEIERPEYFRSEHARYEWAWRAVHEHKTGISSEDAAFMAYFEETAEFEENYADRYRLLAKLYQ